jgi:hypothetical protein
MLRQKNAGVGLTRQQKPGAAVPGGVLSGAVRRKGRGALRGFPVFVKPLPTERFLNDGRDNKLVSGQRSAISLMNEFKKI